MAKLRSAEEWNRVRNLIESGMTITEASKKTGIPFTTIQRKASLECWSVQSRGRPRVFSQDRLRAIEESLKREESLLVAETVLVKAENLEVLARKSLKQDSARVKLLLSKRITEILIRLEDPSIKAKEAAQTVAALKGISAQLYGWESEPDIREMERAKNYAVNLELQRTPSHLLGYAIPGTGGEIDWQRAIEDGVVDEKRVKSEPKQVVASDKSEPSTAENQNPRERIGLPQEAPVQQTAETSLKENGTRPAPSNLCFERPAGWEEWRRESHLRS